MPRSGMLPAQQRFEAAQLAGREIDDGLVVRHELVAFDRQPQVGVELEPAEDDRPHRRVEHLCARLAEGLGAVHRRIRVAKHFFRCAVRRRTERNADAGRQVDRPAVEIERTREPFLHLVGDALRFEDPHVVQQGDELVAAKPRERVPGGSAHIVDDLKRVLEPPGHDLQQLVADVMPEAVVHELEPVEVEEQHREPVAFGPTVAIERRLDLIDEMDAVPQAGKAVGELALSGDPQPLLLLRDASEIRAIGEERQQQRRDDEQRDQIGAAIRDHRANSDDGGRNEVTRRAQEGSSCARPRRSSGRSRAPPRRPPVPCSRRSRSRPPPQAEPPANQSTAVPRSRQWPRRSTPRPRP